jgi:hypothetical protein
MPLYRSRSRRRRTRTHRYDMGAGDWQGAFDAALAPGRELIKCPACHFTIGYYRPARVEKPSVQIALLWLKCMRKGCRTGVLVHLNEMDIHNQ